MLEDFRINIFLSVCRTGSFTKAAEEMGVSQPAVSQNIAELEKSMGVRLFERNHRDLELTVQGKAFLEYAERISYWYKAADSLFSVVPRIHFRDKVRVAVTEDLMYPVSRTLSKIMESNPKVVFELTQIGRGGEPLSENEGFDVVVASSISTGEIDWNPNSVQLSDSKAVAFVSQKSVLPYSADSASFAGMNVISASFVPLPLHIRAKVKLYTDSVQQLVSIVSSSPAFVGIAPFYSVAQYMRSSTLRIIPLPEVSARMTVRFIPSASFLSTPFCNILKERLLEEFSV